MFDSHFHLLKNPFWGQLEKPNYSSAPGKDCRLKQLLFGLTNPVQLTDSNR